jgi:hypothetical protein
MMFNTELTAFPSPPADLAQFVDARQMEVFEATEKIDGRDCLLIANHTSEIYLDIDRNFALVRLDAYTLDIGQAKNGLPPIEGRWLSGRKVHSGFRDYGNGIWLPTRMELIHYDEDGKTSGEDITTVQKMEINPDLDDAFFSDIIPEDAFVADGIRDMAYVYRDRTSIGGLLEDTVPSKKTTTLRWISTCAGLAILVLLIGVAVGRRYMRRKGM